MWISKQQTFTAHSSAEAEIYATNKCAKNLLHLMYILQEIGYERLLLRPDTNLEQQQQCIFICLLDTTTKGLWHVQIWENAVWEGLVMDLLNVQYIVGKYNPSDKFPKEDRDTNHFIEAQNSYYLIVLCVILKMQDSQEHKMEMIHHFFFVYIA